MQMREKVGKSQNTLFFQWFVAPEGRKVGSLKRRVRSQLDRWEMKNCPPLWREAHFEVKMLKTPHVPATFGSWDVEKVHAVVARSPFRSQNVQKTTCTAPLLEVQMSFCVAGARDCAPCQKWAKRVGFVAFPRTMAGVGHLKRICKDAFSVAGAIQETSSSELLGGEGGDFLRGVAFWSIRSCCLLRWFCVTGAALRMTWHHFFVGKRNTLDRWTGKIAKRIGTRLSALHSTFHFWRKSRRIVLFLMWSSSKIEDVSQTCFVLDVVQLKKCRSLAEIASFWMLSSSKTAEVSQNFKFKNWGRLAE